MTRYVVAGVAGYFFMGYVADKMANNLLAMIVDKGLAYVMQRFTASQQNAGQGILNASEGGAYYGPVLP